MSGSRPPIAKLKWRCRRGMRELDVVLERYLEQRYACAPVAEQQAFESLLDLPDPQLFAYLMRRETPADSYLDDDEDDPTHSCPYCHKPVHEDS